LIKIILVDDETRMLDLLSLYLTPKGYQCCKFTSAQAAIQYLETEKADLILLDVMMPEMDGWEEVLIQFLTRTNKFRLPPRNFHCLPSFCKTKTRYSQGSIC
jgi:DNA-binding response OmpR family regulator